MADEKEMIHKDDDLLTKGQIWMRNNKKILMIAGGAVVVLIAGIFAYKYFYLDANEAKATTMLYENKAVGGGLQTASAFYHYENGDYRQAIEGDSLTQKNGLVKILKKYDGTNATDVAAYMMGMGQLHLGKENPENFDKAIKWLESVPEIFGEDEILLTTMAIGAKGDALVEKGDLQGGLSQYETAAGRKSNVITTPYFLMKAAVVHEELGNWSKAVELYKRIKSDYPESAQTVNINAHIGRAEYKAS